MTGPWPASMDGAPESIKQRRFAIAQEALISRARPGTFFYVVLALFYVPLVIHRPVDLAATLIAAILLVGVGCSRLYLYVRTPTLKVTPERWRMYFALTAGATICVWDTFAAFEIFHRTVDASSGILVAASLAFRASGTYTASPDSLALRVFTGPTRLAILIAPAATGTQTGFVLSGVLVIHTLYCHFHGTQLHAEFWRNVETTERVQAAHAELQREVELRERAEIDLRLAQKLESVGRLAAGIAHEINTPLQAMMGNMEFLQEGVDELLAMAAPTPEQQSELEYLRENLPSSLEITQACLERTAAIVRSVRTFAHPDVSSNKAPVDLNRALQTTLDISRHEYAMIADVETSFGDLPLVECFAGELNQALLNIVINAAHAIGDRRAQTGNASERGTITVATSATPSHVRIAIGDTGTGIPEEIRDRLFDPFFTTKAVGKGTGQGLAIARSVIANRHAGSLTFETTLGKGTTFLVELPLGTAAQLAA